MNEEIKELEPFKILEAESASELNKKINEHIPLGYQCFCRMVEANGVFYQSMYRA